MGEGGRGEGGVRWIRCCGEEVSVERDVSGWWWEWGVGRVAYLWRRETWDESPPNEEAMVLNSTCRSSGAASGVDGSTWIM